MTTSKLYQKVIISNYRLNIDNYEETEKQEFSSYNVAAIKNTKNYNVFLYDKFNKKYTHFRLNDKNLIFLDHFEKNTDFDTFLFFDNFITINNNIVDYDYLLSNTCNSYSFIKKRYYVQKNNNVLIIMHGSLQSLHNFNKIYDRLLNTIRRLYNGYDINLLYIVNNDIYEFNFVKLQFHLYVCLNNVTNNNFIFYIAYLFTRFYQDIAKVSYSKIFIINLNYSFINVDSLNSLDLSKNYYVDDPFIFSILNEKQFVELALLSYLYYSSEPDVNVKTFQSYLLKYPSITLYRILNCSSILIN